jgi:hypothetical protein
VSLQYRAVPEFVLEENENALANFYKKGRQSPVLRDEEFRKGLIEKPIRVDPEYSATSERFDA